MFCFHNLFLPLLQSVASSNRRAGKKYITDASLLSGMRDFLPLVPHPRARGTGKLQLGRYANVKKKKKKKKKKKEKKRKPIENKAP